MSKHTVLEFPKHKNPPNERWMASAPFNFVPLPEVVVTAVQDANDLPDHSTFANKDYPHSGYFEVYLTTKSPVYVRAPLTHKQFEYQETNKDVDGNLLPTDRNPPYKKLVKNIPDFFHVGDPNNPVIPGSSVRGMLRVLLEIASYGKMQRVTDKHLFYRSVDTSGMGKAYRDRMLNHVETGFLKQDAKGLYITPCEMKRVPREKLDADSWKAMLAEREFTWNFYNGRPPNLTPRWRGTPQQYARVWVRVQDSSHVIDEIVFQEPKDKTGWREGRLVLTGDMQTRVKKDRDTGQIIRNEETGEIEIEGKQKEFVFLPSKEGAAGERIRVSDELLEQFHDDDQLTLWQKSAFRKNEPYRDAREGDGLLRRNLRNAPEPVFFLREPDADGNLQLTFFGRARMFRLPYKNSALDLVCPALRQPQDVDFAEALFGFVRTRRELDALERFGISTEQGDKRRAYASRVRVTDATLTKHYDANELWLVEEDGGPITPKILATPKPTSFQEYLVQTGISRNGDTYKRELSHYDSPTYDDNGMLLSARTTIRGHKLYWHQGNRTAEDLREQNPQHMRDGRVKDDSTQHTQFCPVRDGIEFKFYVYFENLNAEELGALCWTLAPLGPAQEYCHALGMGKSFGMGAVKLEATLHLMDRVARYGALFAGNDWVHGETVVEELKERALVEKRVQSFEQYVLEVVQPNRQIDHLYELERIGMLLKMMEWKGYAPQLPASAENRIVSENGKRHPNTRYMMIKLPGERGARANEFRDRPVLPDASAFDEGLRKLAQSAPFAIGTWFVGTVEQVDSDTAYIGIPCADSEEIYAVIDKINWGTYTFREDEIVRCEILSEAKSGDTRVLECRPLDLK